MIGPIASPLIYSRILIEWIPARIWWRSGINAHDIYEQFSVRPDVLKQRKAALAVNRIRIERSAMTTAMGIVRAMPGPVFSIASFTGGMALKGMGYEMQVIGCIIGSLVIFLPSALLVLFLFPIWNNLKKYAVVYRYSRRYQCCCRWNNDRFFYIYERHFTSGSEND